MYVSSISAYRTDANIAVRVSKVLIEIPTRTSNISGEIRKQSQVTRTKNTEAK